MIVLNGQPFVRYNIRALYPFAHEIIIVEGAAPAARPLASPSGHSTDGTLDVLREIKREEDPDGKITIVTAEDAGHIDGFWSEKDEMSDAYARRASGDYLWQVDSDEFYRPEDMIGVIEALRLNPSISAITFPMKTFWGSLAYEVTGAWLSRFPVQRVFRWGEGFRYTSHRPPTVIDSEGRDQHRMKPLTAGVMRRRGIFMYHYEMLYPQQVMDKCRYYAGVEWSDVLRKSNEWARTCYLQLGRPFRVHMMYDHVSWLRRFRQPHPPQVIAMMEAVSAGAFKGIEPRQTDDVEQLLATPSYRLATAILSALLPAANAAAHTKEVARHRYHHTMVWRWLQRVRRLVSSAF